MKKITSFVMAIIMIVCAGSSTVISDAASIVKISSLTTKLSKISYVYDGEVKKPKVTVAKSNGKELKLNTDYTVKYASGRKNVGKYAVTITGKGNYSGKKTLYFKINPKNTIISSITAITNGFTVKYRKITTQTTGYQVQYATRSDFSNAVTKTINNNTTASKSVTGLKNQKYYVRVRTYKTVKTNDISTKYYSSWSAVKTVTPKKASSSSSSSTSSNINVVNSNDTYTFTLNTSTKCFHINPNCSAAKKIKPENYATKKATVKSITSSGYTACGICAKKYKK